jgi:hypothetical protein
MLLKMKKANLSRRLRGARKSKQCIGCLGARGKADYRWRAMIGPKAADAGEKMGLGAARKEANLTA